MVDFESSSFIRGHLGVRVSLVAYPVVSIAKDWLREALAQLHGEQDDAGGVDVVRTA